MPTAEVAPSQPKPAPLSWTEEAKAALRARARAKRRTAWAAGGEAAAVAVAGAALTIARVPDGDRRKADRVVAGYWPVGSELDCRPLLHQLRNAGWRCALPVVTAPALPLTFRLWRPDDGLVAGHYGIPEPPPSAAPCRPAVVLVPLVAFDRAGHRLGQGAGHYDRTLAALRASGPVLAIGLAFAVQEEPALPVEPHDQPLDWIVTEAGALRFYGEMSDTAFGKF